MEALGYAVSVFMGLVLGMTGGGGSILTVPILVYLFAVNPITATAYSLFIVGLTALIGGILYYRKGEVELKTGFIFAVPSFVGVYLTRSILLPSLPDPVFSLGSSVVSKALLIMLAFAVLMVATSFSMIRSKKNITASKNIFGIQKYLLITVQGLGVGVVTGFVGAGGGFLIVPALVLLIGMNMKVAVGTSLLIIATNSLVGFYSSLKHLEQVQWSMLITITSIAIVGLFVGTFFSKKVSEKALKKGFGYFVLLMGALILIDQIKKLQ